MIWQKSDISEIVLTLQVMAYGLLILDNARKHFVAGGSKIFLFSPF